jgi:hypothetical protein
MSSQSDFVTAVQTTGQTITIYRNAGNITEKAMIVPNRSLNPFISESVKEALFVWNSEIVDGDIFQDTLTLERYIVLNVNFLADGQLKVGQKALLYKVNDTAVLYELVESAAVNEYGKKNYVSYVRLSDYVNVSTLTKGDNLTPVGDVSFKTKLMTFSGRNLQGYIPKEGNRMVLSDGTLWQIDGLDKHKFQGCYEALCSVDVRV